ncbi:DUF4390 domain-containing protein, partial [bacterium]|nr:DUF4390 domain-containing protein [bacterium]
MQAEYVHVTNIKIEKNEEIVLVSYKISGAFNELLNQKIESGLPAEFIFRLKVIMKRPPWLEKKIIESKIVNKVTYDNITGKYTVNVKTDVEEKEYVFTELAKMQEKMTFIKDFPVIEIDKLTPHREYFLMIRGELTEKKLMLFPLDFLLSFLSVDFSTGWKISDTFSLDKI